MEGPGKLLSKFLSANILWYFILSFIHFDLNIMNWWAVNNVFGRILLTLLELSIIFSSLKMTEYDDREQNNIGGEDE
jgi:hypothetical protein